MNFVHQIFDMRCKITAEIRLHARKLVLERGGGGLHKLAVSPELHSQAVPRFGPEFR